MSIGEVNGHFYLKIKIKKVKKNEKQSRAQLVRPDPPVYIRTTWFVFFSKSKKKQFIENWIPRRTTSDSWFFTVSQNGSSKSKKRNVILETNIIFPLQGAYKDVPEIWVARPLLSFLFCFGSNQSHPNFSGPSTFAKKIMLSGPSL